MHFVHLVFVSYKIEMFDREKKGTINIHEFGALFGYINQWKGTFEGYDRDRSGYIEQNELTSGLSFYLFF